MKNVKNLLQTVMFEIPQLKQHQIDLKSEMNTQFSSLHSKQHYIEKFMSAMSTDMSTSIDRCVSKIKDLEDEKSSDTANQIGIRDIACLQEKVDACSETMRNSIQSVENKVSAVRNGVDRLSKNCQSEFKCSENKNSQLHETVPEVIRDIKRTKKVIYEIEKSLSVLTKHGEFMQLMKTVIPKVPSDENSSSTSSNMIAGLLVDEDEELTIRNKESSEQSPIIISNEVQDHPRTKKVTEGQPLAEPSQNDGSQVAPKDRPTVGETTKERHGHNVPVRNDNATARSTVNDYNTKRENVYLIGDSIAGQVNPAVLGNTNKTFVRKLKAPKIQ